MQPPAQPAQPSPGQPNFEANGQNQASFQSEALDSLKAVVDNSVAEFGDGRYGTTVDETKGLQTALETADANVRQGDLGSGQTTLEQAPRPRKLNEEVRDTLVELHQAERGAPTSDQRFQAMNGLLLEVTKEISFLTDPKKGNLRYTHPQVQARKGVEAAFKQRYHNYFEDAQPENDILQNGEQRTSHDVADGAYDLLLAYAEDKLRDPGVSDEKAEELRIARDTLHLERKNWKEQYDTQDEAVDAVMQMMGRDNELFNEANVRAAIRGSVGDELSRLQELIVVARETSDPVERFNLLNGIQHERSPIQSAEAFDAWRQKRAEKAKAAEEQKSAVMADDARRAIEVIQDNIELPTNSTENTAADTTTYEGYETQGLDEIAHGPDKTTDMDVITPSIEQSANAEQPVPHVTTPNEVVQLKALAAETKPQIREQARNPYEQFVKAALARVPQNVLLESITAVAQDRLMDGQQVDINALRQNLGRRLSGGLEIEPTRLETLAKRVRQNGFYESGGGIWQIQGNPNTPQGQIAAEARRLVREIVSEFV